ncbi:GNAT family N-acetyltransferase [Bacillus sp. AGMB 02131]|uniref:GNAT family N-acetyltransferase n=1 Tax=Peribacillus faecalis TaxID=2772559 RepID=A0A927HAG5_9BACI|nr:GNAT family N-acetyltransferase [Peribacillus faecalis]MBD3107527.1 GNAT family N-acetyltransferase [Peribacillus faecalis]
MNYQIVAVTKADEEILKDSFDEENCFPYFIKSDTKYIGFALVGKDQSSNCIVEFFIMKKYRREGIGKAVVKEIFRLHKGNWVVHQISHNKPAQAFWRNGIDEFTEGNFIEGEEDGKLVQKFTS